MATSRITAPVRTVALLLAGVTLSRLATLGFYPLTDSTESRYGEIARKMLATGNLVTPWFDTGVPFWGKPPLSIWTTAAAMGVFGVNEFAARLSPWLFFVGTAALLLCWPRAPQDDPEVPLAAALIASTSVLGFILAGTVMTDAALVFCTTLCMVSCWRALQPQRAAWHWGWLFFVGLGLGLLAKGPVAVVITALSLGLWLLRSRSWALLWQRLPWMGGTLLTLAIAVPWYLAAERATPGFVRYYLVGEHLQRYLTKGWTGDLYGAGRYKPLGTIWLFLLAAFVPWTFVVPAWFRRARTTWRRDAGTIATREYLLAWALATPLFFTVARNILLAYVGPALPACALLLAPVVAERLRSGGSQRVIVACSLLLSIAAVGVLTVSPTTLERSSQRALFRRHTVPGGTNAVYLYERPFSGAFYSRGQVSFALNSDAVHQALLRSAPAVVVLRENRVREIPAAWLQGWETIDEHAGYRWMERRGMTESEQASRQRR